VFGAQLTLTGWLIVWGIRTNEQTKIIKLFKTNGIFHKHAEEILLKQKHDREEVFAANLDKRILDEVDRFIRERDKK
jgi:hypothetical protein